MCEECEPYDACLPQDIGDCLNYGKEGDCKYRGKKGEGIAVELCDCIIRILDYFGEMKWSIFSGFTEGATLSDGVNLVRLVTVCHQTLSLAHMEEFEPGQRKAQLLICIAAIWNWLERQGVDPEAVMRRKHEYNKTRSWRHDGKVI